MSSVPCFMLEPTERVRRWLRRYSHHQASAQICPVHGHYHQAKVRIEDDGAAYTEHSKGFRTVEPRAGLVWPLDDPRWPTECDCGQYTFSSETTGLIRDTWQLSYELVYRRADTGEEMTLPDAPAGAMWDAWWMRPGTWQGPDGLSLTVKLPDGGDWLIDGPATDKLEKDGPAWTRTGVPPNITASPSIQSSRYHGWLRDGALVDA